MKNYLFKYLVFDPQKVFSPNSVKHAAIKRMEFMSRPLILGNCLIKRTFSFDSYDYIFYKREVIYI